MAEYSTVQFNIDGKVVDVRVPNNLVEAVLEDEGLKNDVVQQLLSQEEPSNNDEEGSQPFQWTSKSTALLLDLYKTEYENFRNPKVKKIILWTKITNSMRSYNYNVTADICDRKFRNLKGTYKTIKDGIKKTGRNRQSWEFFNLMEEIFQDDATINPPFLITSMRTANSCTPGPSNSSSVPSPAAPVPEATAVVCIPAVSPALSYASTPSSSSVTDNKRKRKNRDLEEFRKKHLALEERKIQQQEEIKQLYEQNLKVQQRRNEILEEMLLVLKKQND